MSCTVRALYLKVIKKKIKDPLTQRQSHYHAPNYVYRLTLKAEMQSTAYYTPGLWRFQSHYLGHSKGNDFFLEMESRIFAWSTNGHSSYSNSCSKLHLQHFGLLFRPHLFVGSSWNLPFPASVTAQLWLSQARHVMNETSFYFGGLNPGALPPPARSQRCWGWGVASRP